MTHPLDVRIDCENLLDAHTLVAGFPISLRLTQRAEAAVAIVDGANWLLRSMKAIEQGARRVLVLDPSEGEPSDALRLADKVHSTSTRLVLADAIGDHQAIPAMRDVISTDATLVILSGHAPRPVAELVLAEVRMARALGVTFPEVAPLTQTEWAASGTLSAQLDGQKIALQLNATHSDAPAPGFEAHVMGTNHAARLLLPSRNIARPAVVEWVDDEGRHQLPARYEAPHRAALQLLLADEHEDALCPIEDWLGDVDLAKTLLVRGRPAA